MRKTWAIVLGVVLLTILPSQINSAETRGNAGSFTPSATLDVSQVESGASVIEEDEPGWDCATMGNQICGDADWADEAGQE